MPKTKARKKSYQRPNLPGSGKRKRQRQRFLAEEREAAGGAPSEGGGVDAQAVTGAGGPRSGPQVVVPKGFRADPARVALGHIRSAVRARAAAQLRVDEQVRLARSRGASWRAIGEALGMTHRGALKRYGP